MKHYATFYFAGLMFAEESTVPIPSRDAEAVAAKAPEGAFAFTMWDAPETPDLGPEFTVTAKPQNKTGRFYIGPVEGPFTEDAPEVAGDEHKILRSNMHNPGWERMIKTRASNWQPLTDQDEIVGAA